MKIIATQYNALYTLNVNGEIYVRQFTKHGDKETEDELVWYQQTDHGGMFVIKDDKEFKNLEDSFIELLE